MGELIDLNVVRARRCGTSLSPLVRPKFFFDVSCPLSYLVAERVERRLGEVDWIPVDRDALHRVRSDLRGRRSDSPRHAQRLRIEAEAIARSLRLPLVWPERFPDPSPRAQRAAAFACEIGAGAAFALAASRLAFCGGFDLNDPETIAEAAAASGIPLTECLIAARESWRDSRLAATAQELTERGVTALPAFGLADRLLQGESGLLLVEALISQGETRPRLLAPV
jgi:2-hydroxychromene-2-carboxylate isomerase